MIKDRKVKRHKEEREKEQGWKDRMENGVKRNK